jgi:hypothetical protein
MRMTNEAMAKIRREDAANFSMDHDWTPGEPYQDIHALLAHIDWLQAALEIIAAPSEKAPDAIGVTARNIARSALADHSTGE